MRQICLMLLSSALLLLLGSALRVDAANAAATNTEPSFQQRRAELVARHDQNQDGRLDAAEREAMRLAHTQRRRQGSASSSKIPAEFLAQYDKNKDGEMDGSEWTVAWEAETKILRETYDANRDGNLDGAERQAMLAAVRRGKITGIPAFFAGKLAEEAQQKSGKPDYLTRQKALLHFDTDGDGRASAAELKAIRAQREADR